MDEGKEDVTKIDNEEIKKNMKAKLIIRISELDKMESNIKSYCFPERIDVLKDKEVWELFNKEFTWFFAISVGTLLWVLSNFNKFIISEGLIPYKDLYILSIVLFSSSSLMLAGIQGISYWYQHKNIKYAHKYIMNFNTHMRGFCNLRNNLNDSLEQIDSGSIRESQRMLDKSIDLFKSLDHIFENINKTFDLFEKSYIDSSKIGYSERIIIPPVIIYIFGLIIFSIYIILFMTYHI